MATRVGLCRDVLGHGDGLGQLGLLSCEVALLDQLPHDLLRGGAHEGLRHLRPGDLGEHLIGHHHLAGSVLVDSRQPIANNGARQPHEGTRGDCAAALTQEELDRGLLDLGLERIVQQVEARRLVTQCCLDGLDLLGDHLHGQPSGTVEADEPGLGHGDHDLRRGDTTGHRPADIGCPHPVGRAEAGVPEIRCGHSRHRAHQRDARTVLARCVHPICRHIERLVRGVQCCPEVCDPAARIRSEHGLGGECRRRGSGCCRRRYSGRARHGELLLVCGPVGPAHAHPGTAGLST